jgi:putative heme transporter
MPSEHTILIAGAAVACVIVASLAVTHRETWVQPHWKAISRLLLAAVFVIAAALALAHLDQFEQVVDRVEHGDLRWLALACGFEIVSFGGYVVLTRTVYQPCAPQLGWIASAELTLGGVVATRIFSAGGAGGIAFTAWVLHRAGMDARTAARRLSAFMLLLYSAYIGALLIGGLLVVAGVLTSVPHLLGVAAAVVGAVVTCGALAVLRVPPDLQRRVAAMSGESGMRGRFATRLAAAPQVAGNAARLALVIVRARPAVMLWPLVWWGFDVATLWASFHAFGEAPSPGMLVLCYFLGQLGNLLPLPGGVGGTEGGMVGAFAASGVDAGLALIAVIAYQLISTYLPALPGLPGYLDLRRRMARWAATDSAEAADAQAPLGAT